MRKSPPDRRKPQEPAETRKSRGSNAAAPALVTKGVTKGTVLIVTLLV